MILNQNFYLQMEAMEKNVLIIRADMSSTMHIDNKGKYIIIFAEGPTQRLDDTTLKELQNYVLRSIRVWLLFFQHRFI